LIIPKKCKKKKGMIRGHKLENKWQNDMDLNPTLLIIVNVKGTNTEIKTKLRKLLFTRVVF
jgi:hypothetical protein